MQRPIRTKNLLVAAVIVAVFQVLAAPVATAQINKLKTLMKGKEVFDKVRPMKPEEEQALGESVGHRLKSNYGVAGDNAMQRYLSLVGRTVARQVQAREGFPFRFIVLSADHINAFSVPGGDIYVTSGLMKAITSEAQLAAVLGHEIHHSVERHAAKAVEKSDRWAAAGDVAAGDRGMVLQALTDAATSTVLKGFGREEERECDAAGLKSATAAGYQAEGLAEFLAILKADSDKAGNKNRGGLLGSHPEIGKRIDAVQSAIAAQGLKGGVRLADRYHGSVEGAAPDKSLSALLAQAGSGDGNKGSALSASNEPAPPEKKKKKRLGFGRLKKLAGFKGGSEAGSDDRSTSAAVRGVGETELGVGTVAYQDPEITITAAELAAFIKEGGLKGSG